MNSITSLSDELKTTARDLSKVAASITSPQRWEPVRRLHFRFPSLELNRSRPWPTA